MTFRDTVPDNKLGYLYLNEINNIDRRFETLNNVNTNDNSIMKEEQTKLRDYLLSIKVNNTPIFIRVE